MSENWFQQKIVDKKNWRKIYTFFLYLFAIIGFSLTGGYIATKLGLTKEAGMIDEQRENFISSSKKETFEPIWAKTEEWTILKEAIKKDSEIIYKAAKNSNIKPRLLITVLVPEQLRLFFDEREIFKTFFAPLKILGNQSQFSWGIMGIKKETAEKIEKNLIDKSSPYYLGPNYENMLDFNSDNIGKERFMRITDEKDHYYAYLYASLFLKQVTNQWLKSGQDISEKPGILATLYNIGFENSRPKNTPQTGGSIIKIGEETYSFGSLAESFYYSDELENYFPKTKK